MAKIILRKKISPRISNGHPWIFANEIDKLDDEIEPGGIAEIFYHDGKFAGRGYVNTKSQIVARILTRNKQEQINEDFFFDRIRQAWQYRQRLGYIENCRLVFGEADFLPALVIDKFNNYFVLQTLSLGIDKWKQTIVDILEKIFSPAGIYERNDVPVRELEGLPQQKGFLSKPFDPNIIISEDGLQFHVDLENG